jgi:hypothetical protein
MPFTMQPHSGTTSQVMASGGVASPTDRCGLIKQHLLWQAPIQPPHPQLRLLHISPYKPMPHA